MPEQRTDTLYDFAIIILGAGHETEVDRLLTEVYMQDFPSGRLEVAVIVDADDVMADTIGAYTDKFGRLLTIPRELKRPYAGVNTALSETSALWVLILDDRNTLLGSDLFAVLKDIVSTHPVECICGSSALTPPGLGELETAISLCRTSPLGRKPDMRTQFDHEGIVAPDASAFAWSRILLTAVGGLDEQLRAGSHIDLAIKARKSGHQGYATPRLKPARFPCRSLRALSREAFRNGSARFRLGMRHGLHSPLHFAAAILLALFIIGLLTSIISAQASGLFGTAIGVYLLLVIFYSIYLTIDSGYTGVILYGPLIFTTIHFSSAAGYLSAIIEHGLSRPQSPQASQPQSYPGETDADSQSGA